MMHSDRSFRSRYHDLERRMRALAEADGDIYLPNAEPTLPVDFILIAMEPSLGRWARSAEQARAKIDAGFRNFLVSLETSLLHFSVQRYLCAEGERYHITDFSKGAMYVHRANIDRVRRYDRWYPLLQEELELCAKPGATIVAVGKVVAEQLERRGFSRTFIQVLHYSNQAGPSRNAGIKGRDEEFRAFRTSITLDAVVEAARIAADRARAPEWLREDVLSALTKKSDLSESSLKLIFNYKLAFEAERVARREMRLSA